LPAWAGAAAGDGMADAAAAPLTAATLSPLLAGVVAVAAHADSAAATSVAEATRKDSIMGSLLDQARRPAFPNPAGARFERGES
jgi:hypothetical protein